MTDPTPDAVDDALARGPYLEDAGFTARVLDALPPPRPARGRALVPVASVAAGLVAGALLLGPGAGIAPAVAAWLLGGAAQAVPAAALGALAALAGTGLLVAFAD